MELEGPSIAETSFYKDLGCSMNMENVPKEVTNQLTDPELRAVLFDSPFPLRSVIHQRPALTLWLRQRLNNPQWLDREGHTTMDTKNSERATSQNKTPSREATDQIGSRQALMDRLKFKWVTNNGPGPRERRRCSLKPMLWMTLARDRNG
ncbi:unnamed protein product [Strongylus vulgaris]|uniref:Uncharacterized protein n=1 Tax=Strongylus vulgaris TaxID=40348 RepID=A0A3P7L1U1_STRVU|nr:unnamed protein product [Strongylus vulgaris]